MIFDQIMEIFAPSRCLNCGAIGPGLCNDCSELLDTPPSRCYRCYRATNQFQVCDKCRKQVALRHVWVASNYGDVSKHLLHSLKFERAGYLAKDLASLMTNNLPILGDNVIVTYVSTASNRVRMRGFDQSELLARSIALTLNLKCEKVFKRITKSRQLGATRKQRFEQAEQAYKIIDQNSIKNNNFLIVDDVLTSGATLETLSRLLKTNGAKNVDAAVFAQAID